jgi:hypothetical protein
MTRSPFDNVKRLASSDPGNMVRGRADNDVGVADE